jgi:replication factor C subunit 3/5
VIAPLRSRCLGIRIPAPSCEDITNLLVNIARKEQTNCPRDLAMSISLSSERNVRRAILMLEAAKVQQVPLSPDQPILLPDWELFICRLAREILQEQSPSKLIQARDMLYELLTNCIPPDIILKTLTRELMKALDDELKHELIYWAAYYEHRVQMGSKEIFHLEAFVAKFMAMYKRWIVAIFG